MKYLSFVFAVLLLTSCSENAPAPSNEKEETVIAAESQEIADTTAKESPVSNAGKYHKKFYPGSKQLQIEGLYDENGKRQGIWKYYSLEGILVSMTEYNHGLKHGMSVVYYPSGQINYRGEYKDDQPIGVWITYDPATGKKESEKDYGNGK